MNVILTILILLCSTYAADIKPIYSEKQIKTILDNKYSSNTSTLEVLGIHFYENKEGIVLQLEIELNSNNINYIFEAMNALSEVGQYSKKTISKFIILAHNNELDVPSSYESDASCSIKYFIKSEITKSAWMKDCLSNSITQRKIENWSTFNMEKSNEIIN
ncbi:hypothetical protein HOA87_06535 [bacterium]|jgi:hypothetical protein|nr:hypothetical protein [bacterium]MBT4249453.1 hypothetical protein [bacterium]MBT4928063.1 hypothetical protein [bacterium]MBT5734719.1 hypothetical protein [bacterium]MBT6777619.1 hypothetical protein [bacterium]